MKGLGGLLGNLGGLMEKLGELAEQGEEMRKEGEFTSKDGKMRGMYGFNIKVGLGDKDVEVQPFGNVHKDKETGKAVVSEVREPMVDVFDEAGHVSVVAEMPGVDAESVKLELKDDILTIDAGEDGKRYHKEVLLPASFGPEKMSHTCRNGVLEVKLEKARKGAN